MPEFTHTETRRIEVRFFAALREQAGRAVLARSTRAADAAELYEELRREFALTVPPQLLQVAINERYASSADKLSDGDRVVFIPPVAGG